MPTASHLVVFCAAALALLVVPGPAVLYIVTNSIDQGRRAGLATVAGVHTGTLVHITAATVGLSALLSSSIVAFDAVKYAGAAYLLVVGIRKLLAREAASERRPARSLYRQGIVVNVLNPKTALFFLAFLPQFVDPSRGTPWRQILALGLIFGVLGILSDSAYALVAGTLGDALRSSTRFERLQRYVSGVVFLGLGAFAALTAPPKRV